MGRRHSIVIVSLSPSVTIGIRQVNAGVNSVVYQLVLPSRRVFWYLLYGTISQGLGTFFVLFCFFFQFSTFILDFLFLVQIQL